MPLQYLRHSRLIHPAGHTGAITTITFSPDGRLLASGGLDGRVCVWQLSSGKLVAVCSGKSSVLSLVWLDSEGHLVCGMADGTIASVAIGAVFLKLDGFLAHRYPVEHFAYNGTHLASGAHREVKIWARASEGECSCWSFIADLPAPRRSSYTTSCDIIATSLHWTSGASHPSVLLVTYLSHGIVAFDGRTWARIGGTSVPGRIADASLTKDGRILAVSNMLTGFELFAVKGLIEVEPLFCFRQDVARGRPLPVRFVHGDHALISGTLHGDVNLWDVYSRGKQVLTVGSMCLP
ncbi:WD40 repeat-like protein [Lentinus brumalis]|uniref:WD40 repeat-like protein n=1 Tax=Lentinus brumalis TaxID=2498619 RepID=A0A371CIK6_9APHY|nr:WD40 repeat-like protein [Polyporus brumalis]